MTQIYTRKDMLGALALASICMERDAITRRRKGRVGEYKMLHENAVIINSMFSRLQDLELTAPPEITK